MVRKYSASHGSNRGGLRSASLRLVSFGVLVALIAFVLIGSQAGKKVLTPAMAQQDSANNQEAMIRLKQQEAARMTRSKGALRRFESLERDVLERGTVRVLVRVRAAYNPQAQLKKGLEARVQQLEIERSRERIISSLVGYDPGSTRSSESLPYFAISVNAAGLQALKSSNDVIDINKDRLVPHALAKSVPFIGGTKAWNSGYTGAGQVIAILDTGVDKFHPMLAGKVISEACYSTNDASQHVSSLCPGGVESSVEPNSALPCTKDCEHGTHVAGIAAGKDGYYQGQPFSGVAKDARIIAIQVFSHLNDDATCREFGVSAPCSVANDFDILEGLNRVFELSSSYSIASVNLSLGGGYYSETCDSDHEEYVEAINKLRSVNIATVVASGNEEFKDGLSAPACVSSAISVGSTLNGVDRVSGFSNSASILSLLAPGEYITSAIPGGGYESLQGTSMAAPHVAGAWAIIREKASSATITDILSALSSTGVRVTDVNQITKPRIQIDAALTRFKALPAAPNSLTVTAASSSETRLAWRDASTNETGFKIERKTGENGSWQEIATTQRNAEFYSDSGLTEGTTYFYRVLAVNDDGFSTLSNVASATTRPSAPSRLTATVETVSQVSLRWSDNSSIESSYIIQRRVGSGGWSTIHTAGPNTTTYRNTGLSEGTSYTYRVQAISSQLQSDFSNESSVTTGLGAPSSLRVTATAESQIDLQWNDNSSTETGFVVQRRTGNTGSWETVRNLGANTTSFRHISLNAETTYFYRVYAVNGNAKSPNSNETSGKTTRLRAPSGLTATVVSLSQINLKWDDNSTAERSFQIQRRTTGNWATVATVSANSESYSNTGLSTNTSYSFRVIAASDTSTSSATSEVKATTVYVFQSETHSHHHIGRAEGDGWSVRVGDAPGRAMNFGPYTTAVNPGRRTATFRLMIDNRSADNNRILTIEVYDANSGRVIASSNVTRREFNTPLTYQNFTLTFTAQSGQRLEFRTFWHGGAYVRQDYASVY